MAVNPYFNHIEQTNEQGLFDSLVIEDIQMSGFDFSYIHRSEYEVDDIFIEAKASKFKDSFIIEGSISENITGWGGESEIMNQFGLQIDNTGSILVSQTRWKEVMQQREADNLKVFERPLEGDLIYFGYGHSKFTNNLFIITHVDFGDANWQFGRAFCYRMKVKNYTPNHNEKIEVSVYDIEQQFNDLFEASSKAEQNDSIQTNSDTLVVFNEKNPFGDV